jgi:co-chaperonin GroES (HSP10)
LQELTPLFFFTAERGLIRRRGMSHKRDAGPSPFSELSADEKRELIVEKSQRLEELRAELHGQELNDGNEDRFSEAMDLAKDVDRLKGELASTDQAKKIEANEVSLVPFIPHGRLLVISAPEKVRETSPGGIVIPDAINNDNVKTVIVAAVDRDYTGDRFNPGDRILVARLTATRVIVAGVEYELNRKEDVYGKFTDKSDVSCPPRILQTHFPVIGKLE